MEEGDLPLEESDLPLEESDLPLEESDLPLEKSNLIQSLGMVGNMPLDKSDLTVVWDGRMALARTWCLLSNHGSPG